MRYRDLRFGRVALPAPGLGFDPAGDAGHLVLPGYPAAAPSPIPGTQILESLGPGRRFVLRVPEGWNGDLVVAAAPASRSEFAYDANFSDYVLARGYAFASTNKGIPYNAIVEPASDTPDPRSAYPIPFDRDGLRERGLVVRFGLLDPQPVQLSDWHADFVEVIAAAKSHARTIGGKPARRTFAIGLSIGGGQVRSLLERAPEIVDGGVEWASVYWSRDRNILTYLPEFLRRMPEYVRSEYRDETAYAAIVAAGFPPDRRQDDPAHRSLWDDHYSNLPPFYADLTTFVFARLLEPAADSWAGAPPKTPNPLVDDLESFPTNVRGLAHPLARMRFTPSAAARGALGAIEHTGAIERPLIGIAGDADVFVTPENNAAPYLDAVRKAGRARNYWQYIVEGGPHVDSFGAFGYGLQAQLPFAWAAFDQLVDIVAGGERPSGAGTARVIRAPRELG